MPKAYWSVKIFGREDQEVYCYFGGINNFIGMSPISIYCRNPFSDEPEIEFYFVEDGIIYKNNGDEFSIRCVENALFDMVNAEIIESSFELPDDFLRELRRILLMKLNYIEIHETDNFGDQMRRLLERGISDEFTQQMERVLEREDPEWIIVSS